MYSLLLLLLQLWEGRVLCDELRIHNASELIKFSANVSSGASYSETTVFLDSDIVFTDELSQRFEPIDGDNSFKGTFDGQGYVISNLVINSTSMYAGLFGKFEGAAIQNVVMGSSCSVSNSYSPSSLQTMPIYVGGIIGRPRSTIEPCVVKNNVNMGSVIFDGNATNSLYIGGIAGGLSSDVSLRYGIFIENCANYGSVSHGNRSAYMGGIVGYSQGSESKRVYIRNCLNYGRLGNNEGNSSQYTGGILGYAVSVTLENCVSSKETSLVSANYKGALIGYVYSSGTVITNCYWDKSISENAFLSEKSTVAYSYCSSFDSSTFLLDNIVSIGNYKGTSLIDALNAYSEHYYLREYSKWALNRNGNNVPFTINERAISLNLNSQIILLPNLASEGRLWFDGWYTETSCASPLQMFEITAYAPLYGKWARNIQSYTITFDARREWATNPNPITEHYLLSVNLPYLKDWNNCSFSWWETSYGEKVERKFTVPAHNLTLYAVWNCTRITSAIDLVDLSKVTSSGTSDFKGSTVFLDSDIVFTDELSHAFEPINGFCGTFDGQGYTISNLKVYSTSNYVGLFGDSIELTVKNVVMDSTCSVTSSQIPSTEPTFVGGFVGYCKGDGNVCAIESNINMANITFNGNTNGNKLYLGGISGYLYSLDKEIVVRNCANYGSVTSSGMSGNAYLGGVIGYYKDPSYHLKWSDRYYGAQNCFSYASICFNSTTEYQPYIGGIIGYGQSASIINCVNVGKIFSSHPSRFIGSIVGSVASYPKMANCYAVENVIETIFEYPGITKFGSTSFLLNENVSIGSYTGSSLLGALNAAADSYYLQGYSRWALNKNGSPVAFTVNERASPIILNSPIILLPSLASDGRLWFDGWYTDPSCESLLSSFEVSKSMNLYGQWEENTNSYTITFDTRGGTPIDPITAQSGDVVPLPKNTGRDGCSVSLWVDGYGIIEPWNFTVPGHNLTLHAVWECTRISSAADLVDFSKVVNSGTSNFRGMTVFLDSDVVFTNELSRKFEPIGKGSNLFLGSFDGQGHTISNLEIESASYYVGLFGLLRGAAINNIVMDSTCSFTSYCNGENTCLGSIIGSCDQGNGLCLIKNNVNMGSISLKRGFRLTYSYFYVGGIVGHLRPTVMYESVIINCANYGSLSLGELSKNAYAGGILGFSNGLSSNKTVFLRNCLNYGRITFSVETESTFSIGGIIGHVKYTVFENCLSAGKINSEYSSGHIGSIFGYTPSYSGTEITHCFWTSYVGYNIPNGTGRTNIENSSFVTALGTQTINEFNEYPERNDTWSRWVMLHSNGGTINNLDKDVQVAGLLKSLPVPVKDENTFLFWCKNVECSEKFDPEIDGASEVSALYAHWLPNSYSVTFIFNNGAVPEVRIFNFNETIDYPENVVMEGYAFSGWSPNPERMPAKNITVTAQWSITTPSEYVEVVFEKKDLSEEDVKEIIEKYANGEKFTIVRFEVDKNTGDTIVILKFDDKEKANVFVRYVNEIKRFDDGGNSIKVRPYNGYESFSYAFYPSTFFGFVLYLNI